MELMEEHGLAEIEVEDKGLKIRLRKENAGAAAQASAPPFAPTSAGVGHETGAAPESRASAATDSSERANTHAITSPIVGTFYRAAAPDAESFVEVGDPVEGDTVVCIVEAMKVMNEVMAEVSGSILKILADNGKPVEYGQPLFLISRQ